MVSSNHQLTCHEYIGKDKIERMSIDGKGEDK